MSGKLLIFSAPSGGGKSTIINSLMKRIKNLHFSISATSREPRGEEQNGREYYFLTLDEFREKIIEGAFLEFEEVYHNKYYGTLRSEVEKRLEDGQNVVLDIDVKGAINVKKVYGNRALLIFIQPPSIDVLRQRLEARGTDKPEVILDRVKKAEYELSFAPKFDCIIINDELQKAIDDCVKEVREFIEA